MSRHPMRPLIWLCENRESRAGRFIREVERWVQKSSIHGVEPPSMIEAGANHVVMEPLSLGHAKVANIVLMVMGRAVDILGVTLEVENVQDTHIYMTQGFVSQGTSMVRHPKRTL